MRKQHLWALPLAKYVERRVGGGQSRVSLPAPQLRGLVDRRRWRARRELEAEPWQSGDLAHILQFINCSLILFCTVYSVHYIENYMYTSRYLYIR